METQKTPKMKICVVWLEKGKSLEVGKRTFMDVKGE